MSNDNRMYSDMNSIPFIDLYQNHPRRPAVQRPMMTGQAMRIQVYINNLWAEPFPDATFLFGESTSAFYRNDPTQVYRLYEFILREVVAMRESVSLEGQPFPETTDDTATFLIIQSLTTYEIRQLYLVDNLRPFLDVHGMHFCHELYNFANGSYYDNVTYDLDVRYIHQLQYSEAQFYQEPPPPPLYILGDSIVIDSSDSEENENLDAIDISSSTDDSDVESPPPSLLESDTIDQPSTSIEIQD